LLATDEKGDETTENDPVTARTWGNTRTRRNFDARGEGYVQFTRDPVDFVEAACSIREEETPILDSTDAWVRVSVARTGSGDDGGTRWGHSTLSPGESSVDCDVPTVNRGLYADIEATVAASRLDVPGYDTTELRERIAHGADVVDRCGRDADPAALERIEE